MTNQQDQSSSHKNQSRYSELVEKAKQVGHDTVPTGTTELETKIVEIFKQSGKILTAKEIFSIIQERDSKYFSDKLWYLARKKILVKLQERGYYKYNFATKKD